MLAAQRTLAYTGVQTTTLYTTSGTTTTSEQSITRNGLQGMRMDYLSPESLAGERRGDNGRFLWHYVPNRKQVEQLPSAIGRLRSEANRAATAVRRAEIGVKVISDDTVAGRRATIVQASPTAIGNAGSRRFWIDPTNGAQLRIIVYRPDGSPVSDSYFTQISYNPQFEPTVFEPPSDTVIVPRRVDRPFKSVKQIPPGIVPSLKFDPVEPSYLPAGFRFDTAQMFDYKGNPALGVRYGNGLTVMSIYEAPAPAAGTASRYKVSRPGMLTGVIGGIKIVLLANIETNELIRVFQSLR
jgi:outer membrane lipoprotein-sorting protein